MKRINLFFLLIWFSLPVINAQDPNDYRPFIEDGKVWIVGDGMWLDTPSAIITYYFGGDTIVGGHQCKKWMCDDSLLPYDSRLGKNMKNAFIASIYEEGKQVYYIREGDETPRLLYDFRGTEETFEVSFFPYPYSDLKDSLISCTLTNTGYNDDFHLCYFLIHDNIDHHPNIWYEGIGSTYSPEVNLQILRDEEHRLLQVKVGSEVIFKHRLADAILSTIHGIPTILVNRKSVNSTCYDLSGRMIYSSLFTPHSSLKRGVYIRDGRKVMVK